jgi:hypothetical protein
MVDHAGVTQDLHEGAEIGLLRLASLGGRQWLSVTMLVAEQPSDDGRSVTPTIGGARLARAVARAGAELGHLRRPPVEKTWPPSTPPLHLAARNIFSRKPAPFLKQQNP